MLVEMDRLAYTILVDRQVLPPSQQCNFYHLGNQLMCADGPNQEKPGRGNKGLDRGQVMANH